MRQLAGQASVFMSPLTQLLVPPGPDEPAHEQVRRWIESPVDFWEDCALRYGGIVALNLGSIGRVILLSDPALVQEVFRLPPDKFESRQYNEHYRPVMGSESVFLHDGEVHRRQRKMLAPLLRHDQLLPNVPAIRASVLKTVENWPSGPFNPRPDLHSITFQTMVQILFGNCDSDTTAALVATYKQTVARQSGSLAPWRNYTRMHPQIRSAVAHEVGARRTSPATPGFLTHIATSRYADGSYLSDEECADQVLTLLLAGTDTSAIALSWALHWLSREPEALERLMDELPAAAGDETARELLALPYLHGVYCETLRMYPIGPTPSGRKVMAETSIGPYTFPDGTTLVPCTYLVHRREDIYPNSARFIPQRFLNRKYAGWEYFPFGGGSRTCAGEMLAQYEFKVALTAILQRWQLQATDAPPIKPQRHGTLLAPADGFQVVVL
jgi:cytochrome P450